MMIYIYLSIAVQYTSNISVGERSTFANVFIPIKTPGDEARIVLV